MKEFSRPQRAFEQKPQKTMSAPEKHAEDVYSAYREAMSPLLDQLDEVSKTLRGLRARESFWNDKIDRLDSLPIENFKGMESEIKKHKALIHDRIKELQDGIICMEALEQRLGAKLRSLYSKEKKSTSHLITHNPEIEN